MTIAIEDSQLEQMVSANKARSLEREKPVIRFTPPHSEGHIPEEDNADCYTDADYMDAEYNDMNDWDEMDSLSQKRALEAFDKRLAIAARFFGVLFRIAPASIFFLGVQSGLMDLAFAFLCSVPFVLWAFYKLVEKW